MDLMEYMGSVAAAQYTWGAGILWLAVRTDLMGFRGSVAAAQYTWDAWVSWLPVRTFLWVAIKRWLPGSHFLVGLQIDHGYGSALILWVAGIIWLLGSQSSIGLHERFGCCRNVTLGFIIAMAAGSHFFVGLQVDHGCSHHFYELHKVSGWRFARLLWGTDLIWLRSQSFHGVQGFNGWRFAWIIWVAMDQGLRSHCVYGLQYFYGWRFAVIKWVA